MPRTAKNHKPRQKTSFHPLDLALGNNIRLRRKQLGVSQTMLARAIGLAFQQIQKYERGVNRVSFSKLVEISHALDCRVVDLIGDLDKPARDAPSRDAAHINIKGAHELLAAYAATPDPMRDAIREFVIKASAPYICNADKTLS